MLQISSSSPFKFGSKLESVQVLLSFESGAYSVFCSLSLSPLVSFTFFIENDKARAPYTAKIAYKAVQF